MAETDWCAKAAELRARYEAIRDGKATSEARFGEDMRKFTSGDLDRLERDMREAERNCAKQNGETPTRRRYAIRGRHRSY